MRYRYSDNPNEASEFSFIGSEYMGIEKDGVMKRLPTTVLETEIQSIVDDTILEDLGTVRPKTRQE